MKLAKSLTLFFSLTLLIFTFACDGGGGSTDSGGTGDLSVSLTDSAGSYKAVYITVESLEVHTGGNDNNKNNWETIDMVKDTINLCELTNGVFEELGSIRLDTGKYTQMRLHLSDESEDTDELNILSQKHPLYGNYVITEDDTIHELKIPSGFKTGVKIVKGFTINDNGTTEIILDFDASRSVVEAGNSGQWLLKPTIKVGELDEYSIINGTVTNDSDQGIPNVYVSAQIYDDAEKDENKVVVHAGTITDENGDFSLFVKPDTYNIVAYLDGMEFDYETITTYPDDVIDGVVFELLEATAKGTIESTVSINGGDDNEQYATISYRKKINCNGSDCEMIEIISKNLKSTTLPFEVILPIVDSDVSYQRVASSFDYVTESDNLTLIAGGSITDDIELTD